MGKGGTVESRSTRRTLLNTKAQHSRIDRLIDTSMLLPGMTQLQPGQSQARRISIVRHSLRHRYHSLRVNPQACCWSLITEATTSAFSLDIS